METLTIISKFEKDTYWLEDQYDKLKERLPEEWVAILNKKVIDHDKNLDRLMSRLKKKYPKNFRNMVVEFITRKKIEMIL